MNLSKVGPQRNRLLFLSFLFTLVLNCSSTGNRLAEAAYEGDLNYIKSIVKDEKHLNFKNDDGWTALMTSAESGNISILKFLIENKVFLNQRNSNGDTALMRAVSNQKKEATKLLLENGADPDLKNNKGLSPFHRACSTKNLDIMKLLSQYSKDLNSPTANPEKQFPIHILAQKDDISPHINWMIENKFNLNAKDANGRTALMNLVQREVVKIEDIQTLLKNGADPNIRSNYGETAILLAEETGNEDLLKILKSPL